MDWEAFYNRFREPDFVPGYEIQNRLGGGAFGEVYKARKHSIGKSYAIKFLKIDDEAQRDAIEHELEQVRHFAGIDHPNLVTIEDMGSVQGVPYLIMGFAGEDTLARRLRQGPLERERAVSYFVQACRGVVALHDRRLVHFDLKPSNVFLKGDAARVGDYGLSKMMADGRTTLSFGRGTPQYMAPEMLRNRADHRADVYSLGVILYECFARRLPFEAHVPGAIALREDDQPPAFPAEFPAGLRHVVERCLRLRPEDRYPDVTALLADMGQTARHGDSVRADAYAIARETPERRASPVAPSRDASRTSEARSTARELTRGAVEVARGVWDGLRATTEPRPPPPAPERTGSHHADIATGEVVTLHTLASAEANLMLPPDSTPRATSGALTIPVPPVVQGGIRGTIFSLVALALEVLFSVTRGFADIAGRSLKSQRMRGAGWLRRLGGLLLSAVKLGVFVLLMILIGAIVTLAVVLLLRGTH